MLDKALNISLHSPHRNRSPIFAFFDNMARRTVDICVSSLGILFLYPFLIFIAILIKKDAPGPVFYWGKRIGKGQRPFDILKFRTMYESPSNDGGLKITAKGDARITPIGEWLRSTKLNEFPQLWNVVIGDMSLVGPRPEDPEFVEKWPEDARKELLSVRPGITSPASILYRDEEALLAGGNVMDDYLRGILPTKLRLDQLYVRNRNLFTDLDVLFWTLVVLLPQMRNEAIPEKNLYWGPLSGFMAYDFRWFLVDFLVALGSVTGVGLIWRSVTPLHIGWQYAPLIALEIAVVFSLSNAIRGLNRVYWAKAHPVEAIDLLLSSIIATTLLMTVNYFFELKPRVPPGLFIFAGMVSYLGFIGVRYRERILTGVASRWLSLRRGGIVIGERVLIIGAGELGQFAIWLVRKGKLAQAFTLVGIVDDDPRKQGLRIDKVKVIGGTEDLIEIIQKDDIGIVFFAISNIEPTEKSRILSLCRNLPVRIIMIPNVVEMMRNEFRFGKSNGLTQDRLNLSVERLNNWLTDLERTVIDKDYEAIRPQIEDIRKEIDLN